MRFYRKLVLLAAIGFFLPGCSLFRPLVNRSQEELALSAVKVFQAEEDVVLARESAAASIKTLEALAASDNSGIKIASLTSRSFFMYAFAFVEEESPLRAANLYLRGIDWGAKKFKGRDLFFNNDNKDFKDKIYQFNSDEQEAFLWAVVNFSCWLNLNSSSLKALNNRGKLNIALEYLSSQSKINYLGILDLLQGLAEVVLPESLGGRPLAARESFIRALKASANSYMPIKYFYARYCAVALQDEDLFTKELNDIISFDVEIFPEERLANTLMKSRAKLLLTKKDELFF